MTVGSTRVSSVPWQPRQQTAFLCIKHNIASWPKEMILLLYLVMIKPHFDYCVQFWSSQYKKDVKVLESVQRWATKLVRRLESMSCEERLRTTGLASLEKRKLRGDFIALYNFLRKKWRGRHLFSLVINNKMEGNDTKLCWGRFRMDIRNNLFTMRMVKH